MPLYLSLFPAFKMAAPLQPCFVFFFKTILIMPEVPSGLNLADGLVMTSILSIELAGSCCSTSALDLPISGDGLPLMSIITSEDPLKFTVPSISTSTEGMFFKISLATPLCAIISCETLYTFLSIEVLSNDFLPVTITSLNDFDCISSSICPRFSFF